MRCSANVESRKHTILPSQLNKRLAKINWLEIEIRNRKQTTNTYQSAVDGVNIGHLLHRRVQLFIRNMQSAIKESKDEHTNIDE